MLAKHFFTNNIALKYEYHHNNVYYTLWRFSWFSYPKALTNLTGYLTPWKIRGCGAVYDWFPVNLNYVSDFLGITKIIVNIMKISTKEKILVLYDELINKHQSDCFDNPKFSGLCVRKIKMMLTWLSFASYLSLWAYPEVDPINMTRTEALVYLVSTLSSLKCVRLSLDSL